jgi:hypothetical protein
VVKEKAIRRGECIQSRDYEMFHLDAFLQLGKFRALVTTNGIRAWAFSSDSGYLLRNFPAVTLDEMKVRTIKQKLRCLAQNPIASSVRIMQRKRRYGSIRLLTL